MKGKIQDIKGIGDHSMVKAKGCPSPLGPTTSPDIQIRANTLSTYIEELKSQEMWVREARCCVDTFDKRARRAEEEYTLTTVQGHRPHHFFVCKYLKHKVCLF